MNLKWDPSVDDGGSPIDGYQIHRGTRSSELSFVVGETRELIFNDTTVINGQTYYYAVRAHNYIDYGPMSNIVKVIPFSKPSPPRNLTVDAIGDSYVNLSWSPSEKDGGFPIWSYRLYRSEGSNPIPSLIMDNNKLFYSDTSAKNGIRYTYFVTAESIKGESRPSDPVNATPMGVPGMIQKIIVVTGGGFVKLDWDPPNYTGGSPLLGYEISRSDQSKIIKFTTGPETDEYNDTQVQNGKRYWYQIRSWNTVGYSLYSREYAGEPEDVPGPPRNLTMKMSSRTVELFWDQPSSDGGFPVQFYYIYRSDHTNEWRKISETGPEVTTFKDRSLVNGRTYGYRVTAVSLKGESLPATIMDVVPLGIPTSPNDFSLRAGDGFVDLSWKAPSDTGGDPIDEYMLLRGDVSTTLRELVVLSGSDLSYNDTSVTNGVTYYYAVKAKNIVGEGMATDTLSARPGGLPSPPSDIVIIPYDRSVEITWKPPKNDGGYPVIQVCIYRGTDENTLIKILGIDQATGSYLDTGLENGRTYYYSLCTVNDIGQGIRSDIYSVTPLGKPSSPLSVIVETRSDKARIVWDVPDDDGGSPILSYRIYRSDLQRDPVMIGEVDPDNFYFEDFDVNEGRSYFYSVSATNSQGEGPASEGVLVEIPEGSGPPIILIIILLFVSILLGGGAYLYIRSKRRGLGQDRYRQME